MTRTGRHRMTATKPLVTVLVPAGYMRILRTEAELYGLTVSQFAEQLLRLSVGLPSLTPRPLDSPRYDLTDEELRRRERFVWYLRPDFSELLERARLCVGAVHTQPWLIHALNRWVGRDSIVQRTSSAA